MIKGIFQSFVEWVRSTIFRSSVYRYQICDDLPMHLKDRTVYVQGVVKPWLASLLCPCGCGEVLHMNLISTRRPVWSIQFLPNELISFQPSLWKKTGCKSHFFLKRGKVYWV